MTTIVTLSELERDAESFLQFKRAMGHPYKRGAFEIDRFLRFVRQHWGEEDPIPLAEAIQRWVGGAAAARLSRLPTSSASFGSSACSVGDAIRPAMCPGMAGRR
ncbi:hypothetical protein ACFX5Q_28410 [Mesorhizobium sp. IMUNJ 23033]|uniref:hypothetical protein n=1 Tax=Mesorhizobium sp. IMUNJ 23033 TaxID=3378039 RepID=UPI00384D375B